VHLRDSFTKYETLITTKKVFAGNNSKMKVIGTGTVNIILDINGTEIKATLENVLYFPTLNVNFLSSSTFMDKEITFLFKTINAS
jgi:hypothetical protein